MRQAYPEKPEAVYLFGTCLIDMTYPEAGMSAIHLLQREGVRVLFPQDQTCCGQPAYNSGFVEEARQVAWRQVQAFAGSYPVVIPSGSCGGMIRKHYPHLFEGDPRLSEVRAFAERVFEFSEFLVHVLKVQLKDLGPPVTVTWHTSCHAKREMELGDEGKQLVRQLNHVTLVELEREAECCGFGGTFAVKQPQLSAAMVEDKVRDVQNTGCRELLTGDCGCLLNISGVMQKQELPVQGRHLADFLWERTRG
ncbi:MAG: (Fe-S)-binding protein [bacterium]|jgi:L-lactate dehydrogenase complex protein LldE